MKIALMTGANSGIGKEFCIQIDKNGYDEIWGIGLGEDGFESLAQKLSTPLKKFNLDLTKPESFDVLSAALKKEKPEIKLLVNASGFGKFGRYDEYDTSTKVNMIDLNCSALVKMTDLALKYMGEGGKIIQIASVASFQPTPYVGIYAATKAFVLSYSRSLNVELKSRKISVMALCPFWTKTAFFDRAKKISPLTKGEVITKYTAMYEPSFIVKKALKALKKGKDVCVPGFVAKSQVCLVKLLPHKLVMKVWCNQQKFQKKYAKD